MGVHRGVIGDWPARERAPAGLLPAANRPSALTAEWDEDVPRPVAEAGAADMDEVAAGDVDRGVEGRRTGFGLEAMNARLHIYNINYPATRCRWPELDRHGVKMGRGIRGGLKVP